METLVRAIFPVRVARARGPVFANWVVRSVFFNLGSIIRQPWM